MALASSKSNMRGDGKMKIVLLKDAYSAALRVFGDGLEENQVDSCQTKESIQEQTNHLHSEISSGLSSSVHYNKSERCTYSNAESESTRAVVSEVACTEDFAASNGASEDDKMAGWSWSSELSLYVHNATKVSWDPATQQYGSLCSEELTKRESAPESTSVVDVVSTSSHCAEQSHESIDKGKGNNNSGQGNCSDSDSGDSAGQSTSSDGDAPALLSGERRAREDSEDLDGEEWNPDAETETAAGAQVCGDWIWDGEFWVTADGLSYHPGLGQYFRAGQRIWLREQDKPAPDAGRLHERWVQDRYILDYGAAGLADAAAAAQSSPSQRQLPPPGGGGGGAGVHVVGGGGALLGKSRSCSVYIRRPNVSRRHAQASAPRECPGHASARHPAARGPARSDRRGRQARARAPAGGSDPCERRRDEPRRCRRRDRA